MLNQNHSNTKETRSPTNRRERNLLLIAAAFLLVGTLTLSVSNLALDIGYLALGILAFTTSFAAAHIFLNRYLPHRDPLLLPVAALLTSWGILLIGRLAINFFMRQAIWLLISTALLLIVVWFSRDLRWLRRFRYTWLFGGLALLATTLILGVNPSGYGLRLWLGISGIYFQPSELLKLLMIVYMASYLAERRELLISERWQVWRWQLPPLAYVGPLLAMLGLAVVLLAWQQDLGAAMLFFFTFLAMLYLATNQWKYVLIGLVLFAIVGVIGYQFSSRVALRIDGWINPWPDAADRTFQIVQSLLAFGAGGIFGRGLGLGDPTYIPAVHTDFVFAATGEEFGLAGTLVIVALYGVLLLRGFRTAARAPRLFERFLAAGLTSGLVIQAWVIMAGNAKLAPIAGVTLPFISYGGSSLLTNFIALALLLRISNSTNTQQPSRQPSNKSLHHLAHVLSLGLALLAAVCGYWAVARAEYLRTRNDNPRRVLYEQRVVRGRILDRDGIVLADVDIAQDGTVTRRYSVPEAVPPVGYASLRYGTGGIEATFDAELRGEADQSPWQIAWGELLHRPPHGRDVRLTLDAALQVQAQQSLGEQAGAVVLLDAATGEILAMASNPTFDPEQLNEMWGALSKDPRAPLVNRATQGLYQPGAALQTIILAEALHDNLVDLTAPTYDATTAVLFNGTTLTCSAPDRLPSDRSEPHTLAVAYAAACPALFADLGAELKADGLEEAFERWALTTPPLLEIPTESADWSDWVKRNIESPSTTEVQRAEAIGQGQLTVSPLQMALVAGTLANAGTMPTPRLVLYIRAAHQAADTQGTWQEQLSTGESRVVLRPDDARELLAAWPRYPDHTGHIAGHWGVAIAGKERPPHAWFLGIAPANAPRYAVAVLLEHATNPHQAVKAGSELLEAINK
ncbi:MAG: FtsW/RodA/SpoVE family cell cycle protein [Chloroflexi bacterium]|nr:FtsW/RodA/SpoVE family cell cycle protein [Chloroflexota bacterium]